MRPPNEESRSNLGLPRLTLHLPVEVLRYFYGKARLPAMTWQVDTSYAHCIFDFISNNVQGFRLLPDQAMTKAIALLARVIAKTHCFPVSTLSGTRLVSMTCASETSLLINRSRSPMRLRLDHGLRPGYQQGFPKLAEAVRILHEYFVWAEFRSIYR
jgi:hypothetical protein